MSRSIVDKIKGWADDARALSNTFLDQGMHHEDAFFQGKRAAYCDVIQLLEGGTIVENADVACRMIRNAAKGYGTMCVHPKDSVKRGGPGGEYFCDRCDGSFSSKDELKASRNRAKEINAL